MYISYNGQDPYLEQWQAFPAIVSGGKSIWDTIFGGGGVDKGRQKRIGTSVSGGESILAGISDLPQLIKNIENFLSGKTSWFGCPPGTTGTTGRSCYVAACKMAVSLGWQSQHYADCHPYMGDEKYNPNPAPWQSFVIAKRDLMAFYRGILPSLKEELRRRTASRPAPTVWPTPPPPPVWPTPPPPPVPPTVQLPPEPGMPALPKEKSWWEKLFEPILRPPEPSRPIIVTAPGMPTPPAIQPPITVTAMAPGAPAPIMQAGLGGISPNALLIGGVAVGAILLSQGRSRRR